MYDPSRDPRLFERKIDANGDEYEVMLPPPARGKHGLSQPSDPSVAGIQRRNTPPPLYYSQGPEPSGPCLIGGWSADLLLEIRYLATRAIEERWEEWNPQWPRAVIRFLSRLIGDREAGAYKCVCHWSTMSRDVGLERTDLVSWEVWRCHNYLVDTNDELWTQGQAHVHITPENAKQMIEIARQALPRNHARMGTPPQIMRLSGVYAQRELQNGKEDIERKDWYPYPVVHESVSARSDSSSIPPPPPPVRGVKRLDLPPWGMRLEGSQEEEELANVKNSLAWTPPKSRFAGFLLEGEDDAEGDSSSWGSIREG